MPINRILLISFCFLLALTGFFRVQSAAQDYNPWQEVPAIYTSSESAAYQRISKQNTAPKKQYVAGRIDENGALLEKDEDEVRDFRSRGSIRNPGVPPKKAEKFSTVETMYSGRIVDRLEQFGYDMFGVPEPETRMQLNSLAAEKPLTPMGAVQDDFILNSGDEVEVVFTGQRSDRGLYKIDSRGVLVLDDFPPIPAAGRTIGQVRVSIEAAARNLHNTQAYISLSSVRQIGVLIVGHVKKPGRQSLTVFHTVIDALMEAGGVDKTGSLRQIKLVRHGRSTIIDLYALLMHGSTNMDLQLRDGDRIVVPSIGPTVAIAGEVKRPGIYEIQAPVQGMHHRPEDKSQLLSLNDMLDLGGGVLAPGQNRFLKLDVSDHGGETVQEVDDAFKPLFGDGDILMVSKGKEKRSGTVELDGHTMRPGIYALDETPTLSALLPDTSVLDQDIYPLIGIIERWNDSQMTRQIHSFPLRLVLNKDYDRKLSDGDVVYLFSNAQIDNLKKSLNEFPKDSQANLYPVAVGSRDPEIEEQVEISDPLLQATLLERTAFIRGAVRKPGAYPVAEGVTLDSLLAVAGGLTLEASTSNIEITSKHQQKARNGTVREKINFRDTNPETVTIGPGDSVRVNQKFKKVEDNSVLIIGEIQNPGRYDLLPGDKVSDLINRAGGLTRHAYPAGGIFSRESERKAEQARFRGQARALKKAVAAALEANDEKVNATKIAEARALANELEAAEALGRITVEMDPAVLAVEPELDMLLQPADRLYIPKRALTVRVSGEVLSPASLQFREGKKPRDYIDEAGGFTFHADSDRSFVLYPDGSAQPLQVSAWNHRASFIPPGSTIVVPRDPEPFDFVESAKDISQILSNLAITAIFIDDVRNDN